jgi:hypothetical protein
MDCCLRSALPEQRATRLASAFSYRLSEDIGGSAVVMFELAFHDVERQIFCGNLVIGVDDGTLEDAPEAFNRLRG